MITGTMTLPVVEAVPITKIDPESWINWLETTRSWLPLTFFDFSWAADGQKPWFGDWWWKWCSLWRQATSKAVMVWLSIAMAISPRLTEDGSSMEDEVWVKERKGEEEDKVEPAVLLMMIMLWWDWMMMGHQHDYGSSFCNLMCMLEDDQCDAVGGAVAWGGRG